MTKSVFKIESKFLQIESEVHVYGHYGVTVLLFPNETDSAEEAESRGIIESLLPFIRSGKVKVFSIEGFLNKSWLKSGINGGEASNLHYNYNEFIINEVLPFVYDRCGGAVPIITLGAEHGAYIAANTYFRRPDLFLGTISLSGVYDLRHYSGDYFDDNCYFNSPVHYLPNLNDNYWLSFLMNRHHVYIVSGESEINSKNRAISFADILKMKRINHNLDLHEKYKDDYSYWRKIVTHYFKNRL